MTSKLAAVVMAGGLGTRMRSATPKHLHPLLGRRMVDWVLEAARPLGPEPLVVVASPETASAFGDVEVAVQEEARGTGDAIASARAALKDTKDVLVLSGDTPLLAPETLRRLVEHHRAASAAATILTFRPPQPGSYGRVIRDGDGGPVRAIVEAADASFEELEIGECNSSIYVFDAKTLWPALDGLSPANAQGELYLTDAVRRLVDAGETVRAFEAANPAEAEGVNTRSDLALAAGLLRERINEAHMLAGVTIVDPSSTWIDPAVELAADSTIQPFTVLRGQTRVGAGAEVGPHAVAVDSSIGAGATVGPFCYLRPGAVLEAGAKAGTFVEIKNSRIGERTKVPHLSYIGDAEVGADTNIGAGSITANLPHQPDRPKGATKIGRNVRTGIHNGFEAPVTIGDDAWIAGGSYITDDVPPASLAGFPPRQVTKEGYVRAKRDD